MGLPEPACGVVVAVATTVPPDRPIAQLALGKRHYPHAKQVHRLSNEDGSFAQDIIALETEKQDGEPQLQQVMRQGTRCQRQPSLEESRDFCLMQRIRLPVDLLDLAVRKPGYRVRYSEALEREMQRLSRLRVRTDALAR